MIPVSRPSIGAEELAAISEVFQSGWLGLGAVVKQFEDRIRAFLGGDPTYVVAVNTGTTALHLALDALGIGPGDEVIIPSLTFVATGQAVLATGATPVLCDIEPDTLNIDVASAASVIGPLTKAIVPVHYRGFPSDMDTLLTLAQDHGIRVVEDAAHAFGTKFRGKPIGSFGDVTCFSFDPIKNITCGEGGAVIVHDDVLYQRLLSKRILGIDKDTWSRYRNERSWTYDVIERGYRYHMPNINAAIGLRQLDKFEAFNRRKIEVATRYDAAFASLPGIRRLRADYDEVGLFTYITRITSGRDDMMSHLKTAGVGSGVHYIPLHHFSLFRDLRCAPLPGTDEVAEQILTLPLLPDMTDDEATAVIRAVEAFATRAASV